MKPFENLGINPEHIEINPNAVVTKPDGTTINAQTAFCDAAPGIEFGLETAIALINFKNPLTQALVKWILTSADSLVKLIQSKICTVTK